MSRSSSSVAACWPAWDYLAFCLEPWSHSETRPSVYFHTDYRLPDSTWPGLGLALVAFCLALPSFFAYRLLPPTFSLYHRHHIAQLSNEHHMHAIDDNDDNDDVDGSLFPSLSPAHSLAAPSHHPPRPAHRKPYPTDSATSSTPRRRVRSAIDW